MIRDPETRWNGPYPYAALEKAGLTPESAQDEVANASFTLMSRRMMNPVTQKAWDELRELPTRLLADALQYDVDAPAELGRAQAWVRRERVTAAEVDTAPYWSMPPELLASLGDDLPDLEVTPPGPVGLPPDTAEFPSQGLVDRLIRFDR